MQEQFQRKDRMDKRTEQGLQKVRVEHVEPATTDDSFRTVCI